MKKSCITLLLLLLTLTAFAKQVIYEIPINDEINSKSWIYIQRGLEEANKLKADLIIIHLNTYGGELSFADSIRTALLNSEIPVVMFIDNNAASAGARISLACQRIYMRKGGSIGAATVVSGTDGEQMPDKYQSYMRAMMRSTAEAHGKDSLDRWIRDPLIAEAMVDDRVIVPHLIDSGKTLTLTTKEAIEWRYCEGQVESIKELLQAESIPEDSYTLHTYKPTAMHSLLGMLTSTILRSILIMLIIGGIYFELQSPGIGFPLVVSIVAAILYFAPLYIEGLAANWEIIIFFVGVALIILELFVIPGFGIAGIAGICLVVFGLVFSLIDNVNFNFERVSLQNLSEALFTVTIGLLLSAGGIIYLSNTIGSKGIFRKLALQSYQPTDEGYIGVPTEPEAHVGQTAIAATDLRPVGKVQLGNEMLDAIAETGFITKGSNVTIIKYTTGQVVVRYTYK